MKLSRTAIVLLVCCLTLSPSFGKNDDEKEEPRMGAKTFKGLELRGIGPALMSGRIADIAVDPGHRSTWYVAVGSGGVWKTSNRGTT